MAISTTFTEANLELLEQAIVEGVKRVKYTDKEIEYRSLDEMIKLRNLMRKELCKGTSKTDKGLFGGRRINAKHSKGLC